MSMPSQQAFEERAALYLCLARAFQVPQAADSHQAMSEWLSADLNELLGPYGAPAQHQLTHYQLAIAAIPDQAALLQHYSRLFLSPPIRVNLNTSIYFRNEIGGDSLLDLEQRYAKHRLARAEGFRDLPDHLSMQLEFLAWLQASAAEALQQGDTQRAEHCHQDALALLREVILGWLPSFIDKLRVECEVEGLPTPYLHLAELLRTTAVADAQLHEAAPQEAKPSEPLQCQSCGDTFEDARVQQVIELIIAEGGEIGPLLVCPRCRAKEAEQLGSTPRHFPPTGTTAQA